MSTNPLYLQLVKLFTTDADLEVLVAECMSRMTDFSTLCEEQNRIDAGVIDSELELTTPQAKRLNAIHEVIIHYPTQINPAYPEALDATVGMLTNDRELPTHVIASLREVVEGLVKKNGLILTAEPTVAAHIYDLNPSESYPSGKEMLDAATDGILANAAVASALNPFHLTGAGARGQMFSQLEAEEMFVKPLKDDGAVYNWDALRKEVEATGMKLHPIVVHAPRDSHQPLQEGMRSLIPVRAEDGGVPNVVTDNIVYPELKKTPTPVSGVHVPVQELLGGDVSKLHATLTAQARATSGYGYGVSASTALEVSPNVSEGSAYLTEELFQIAQLDPFPFESHGSRVEMFRHPVSVNLHGDADYKKFPELLEGNNSSTTDNND